MKPRIRHAVAAIAVTLISIGAGAADAPADGRSTPGAVVPSSGTTAASQATDRAMRRSTTRPGKTAGSLSGPPAPDCAALRRRYAASQSCFGPYRLANGGIKPEAFKHCREVADPSPRCGPETASPGQ